MNPMDINESPGSTWTWLELLSMWKDEVISKRHRRKNPSPHLVYEILSYGPKNLESITSDSLLAGCKAVFHTPRPTGRKKGKTLTEAYCRVGFHLLEDFFEYAVRGALLATNPVHGSRLQAWMKEEFRIKPGLPQHRGKDHPRHKHGWARGPNARKLPTASLIHLVVPDQQLPPTLEQKAPPKQGGQQELLLGAVQAALNNQSASLMVCANADQEMATWKLFVSKLRREAGGLGDKIGQLFFLEASLRDVSPHHLLALHTSNIWDEASLRSVQALLEHQAEFTTAWEEFARMVLGYVVPVVLMVSLTGEELPYC